MYDSQRHVKVKRRNLLAATAAAMVTTTAGCFSSDDNDESNTESNGDDSANTQFEDGGNEGSGNSGGLATLDEPIIESMEHVCWNSNRLSKYGPEALRIDNPMLRAGNSFILLGVDLVMPNPDYLYPTLDIEQNAEENTIRILTQFTDEPPNSDISGEEPGRGQKVPSGITGTECVEGDDTDLVLRASYRIMADEEDTIEDGVTIRWDVEYPDGSVEKLDETQVTEA